MKLNKLNTKFLGRNIKEYKEIDSTQLEMWRKIKNKEIKNGTIIIAETQTNGKGTHGRKWYTDEKNNIALSMFIEANCTIEKLEGMTLEIAQTLVDVFKKLYDIRIQIKNPNDIVFKGKKIGGILTETKLIGNDVKNIVIGIGINTNQEKFDKEISEIASSIKNEFKIKVENNEVISEFCNEFEKKILKRMGR